MVPTVVEFDNPGADEHVSEQARRIASGMAAVTTMMPKSQTMYTSRVVEVVRMNPEPLTIKLDDLTAPGSA